jgi:hypothetical protein
MGGKGSGTPNTSLLRLDGVQIDAEGNETSTDFFAFLALPEDHKAKLDKVFTPEQALKFRNHIVTMRIGTSAAIPRLCSGPRCPVKTCPFHIEKNWILAEPCPLELALIVSWTKGYVYDLNINPSDRTEMVQVNKLVECDIIDYRANIGLAVDEEAQTLLRLDTSIGPVTSETLNVHPLIEVKDRVHKVRQQVLEGLAATRKERYRRAQALKQTEGEGVGDYLSRLKKTVKAMSGTAKPVSIGDIKNDAEKLAKSDEKHKILDADWESNDF